MLRMALALTVLLTACGKSKLVTATSSTPPVERRVMLLAESRAPAFFLGPAPDAPAVGFGSSEAKLILLGPRQQGRVLVRVHGRLSLEAYVPEDMLELRAQRAASIRGTPLWVGPGDRVRVLGAADAQGNVSVAARARVGSRWLGPFQGRMPLASLAATEAPTEPGSVQSGVLYALPANTPLPLFSAPDGSLLTLVPPQPQPQLVTVTAVEEGWFALRAGEGPLLVGYSNAPLVLQGGATARPQAASPQAPVAPGAIPRLIAEAKGALKRVASGAEVRFRGQRIASFRSAGWARVLGAPADGTLEVFAAADELVALRGVIALDQLSDAEEMSTPAAEPERTAADELGSPL